MSHLLQHADAGEGVELTAPDAVLTVKVDARAFDLGTGAAITIPPGAVHTFTAICPTTKFLVVSLTDAMGKFHADLDAAVPQGTPLEEAMGQIEQVLGRHDVQLLSADAPR